MIVYRGRQTEGSSTGQFIHGSVKTASDQKFRSPSLLAVRDQQENGPEVAQEAVRLRYADRTKDA